MATFWPPLGRWAEKYGSEHEGLTHLPRSQVSGRTGYALLPGGFTQLSVGFLLSISAHSRNKEAAYLFIKWLHSPDISLRRVMYPAALRDPYRLSHVRSQVYRSLWPTAGEYLDTLAQAASGRMFLDLMIPGHAEYAEAFHVADTDIRLGASVPRAMRRLADAWDAITDHHGRRRQRAAYAAFLSRAGPLLPP
ncbi:MAG: hypothetical protein AB2A00_37715 [Myxococcota bacterium]